MSHPIASFFAGAFLINAVPHLVAGLEGRLFPTPFAKPSGRGDSGPTVNFLWGFANLVAGIALLHFHPVELGANADSLCLSIGGFVIGLHLSWHFGKVRRGKE